MPSTTTTSAPGQRGRKWPNRMRTAKAPPATARVAGLATPSCPTLSIAARSALSYELERPVSFSSCPSIIRIATPVM